MFADNLDGRQNNTYALRNEVISLRKKMGYSANSFAKNILHRPQSWLSQVESGKTHRVSNKDLISLFSILLDTDDSGAESFLEQNYDRLFGNNHDNCSEDSNINTVIDKIKTARSNLNNIEDIELSQSIKESAIEEIKHKINNYKEEAIKIIESL